MAVIVAGINAIFAGVMDVGLSGMAGINAIVSVVILGANTRVTSLAILFTKFFTKER